MACSCGSDSDTGTSACGMHLVGIRISSCSWRLLLNDGARGVHPSRRAPHEISVRRDHGLSRQLEPFATSLYLSDDPVLGRRPLPIQYLEGTADPCAAGIAEAHADVVFKDLKLASDSDYTGFRKRKHVEWYPAVQKISKLSQSIIGNDLNEPVITYYRTSKELYLGFPQSTWKDHSLIWTVVVSERREGYHLCMVLPEQRSRN